MAIFFLSLDIVIQVEVKGDLFGTKFFIFDLLSMGSLFLLIILIPLNFIFHKCGQETK